MRILIVGAGAIGSLVGARLTGAGHNVGLLGRPGFIARVRADGLRVAEPDGSERNVAEDLIVGDDVGVLAQALEGFELAIVATKAYDTEEACRDLLPFLPSGLRQVLLLQNGVGSEEIAASLLGKDRLVSGAITMVVEAGGPGRYALRSRRGGLALAPVVPVMQDVDPLAEMFKEAGVTTRTYTDYRAVKWSKLLLNMLGNAVPAIEDLPPEQVYADDRLYALEVAAFREALRVMTAAGVAAVSLPGYPVSLLASLVGGLPPGLIRPLLRRLVAGGRAGKKPSLQIDLERGRNRSEVTFLNGAVAREAARRNISAPVNEAIYEVLTQIVRGDALRDAYRHAPDALHAVARSKGWRQ